MPNLNDLPVELRSAIYKAYFASLLAADPRTELYKDPLLLASGQTAVEAIKAALPLLKASITRNRESCELAQEAVAALWDQHSAFPHLFPWQRPFFWEWREQRERAREAEEVLRKQESVAAALERRLMGLTRPGWPRT